MGYKNGASQLLREPFEADYLRCGGVQHIFEVGSWPQAPETSKDSRKTPEGMLRPLVHHRENHNKPCALGVGGVQRDAGFVAKEDGFRKP